MIGMIPQNVTPLPESLFVSDDLMSHATRSLGELVSAPSVEETVGKIQGWLERLDFKVTLSEGSCPCIVAQREVDASKPTVTLYSHYDVRNDTGGEVEESGEFLTGPGVSDGKGAVVALVTALRVYKASQSKLPVNLQILIEGERYQGSKQVGSLKELRKAAAVVVFDGKNQEAAVGSLTESTRGRLDVEVVLTPLKKAQGMHLIAKNMETILGELNGELGKTYHVSEIQLKKGNKPAKAAAQISIPLGDGKTVKKVESELRDYLVGRTKTHAVDIAYKVLESTSDVWQGGINKEFSAKYLDALDKNFPSSEVLVDGEPRPILAKLRQLFGPNVECIVAGIADNKSDAEVESQSLSLFRNAIDSLVEFLKLAGESTLTASM